jgi:c(7)-type cytochrome triheme protein
MLKKILACGVMSLFLMSCAAILAFAAADQGPAEITLGESGKKPALFPHKKHQDMLKCADCHHGMADGKQVPYAEDQKIDKCDTCHNATVLAGKMKDKLALDTLKGAGHGNCLECHKEKVKSDAALKEKKIDKCATCHPKK